jgi:3-oxoadipate CoA-transferase beta subunit
MTNNNLAKVEKGWERGVIASKIANDLPHASYVNLGIGMPELVSQYIKEDREIIYHSENGLLGMGPTPNENEIDFDLINAGKKTSYNTSWWKFLSPCR